MQIGLQIFRSKVARRILTLFVVCAMTPIAILALVSFGQVTGNLAEQGRERLRQDTKAFANGILERLFLLAAEQRIVASGLRASQSIEGDPASIVDIPEDLQNGFLSLALADDGIRLFFGELDTVPELDDDARNHLSLGRAALTTRPLGGSGARAYMISALDPGDLDSGLVVGEISLDYLWTGGVLDLSAPDNYISIYDADGATLFSNLPAPVPLQDLKDLGQEGADRADFEWTFEEDDLIGTYREILLGYNFFTDRWTVVLMQSSSAILEPIAHFRWLFPFAVLMALWVVLLLGITQIRKSLVPLEKLKEGTQRIAARDFESRVKVTSDDEFEELADSFNFMAGLLGSQFQTLSAMTEIDRAILSALDISRIVRTVLQHMPDVLPSDAVGVVLVSRTQPGRVQVSWRNVRWGGEPFEEEFLADLADLEAARVETSEGIVLGPKDSLPSYVQPIAAQGNPHFFLFPIAVKERLEAILCLAYVDAPSLDAGDIQQARQVADQIAVAVTNARLMSQMDDLSWGALLALARTIDAKSSWTAGHSERVTNMALKIGREMGLAPEELDDLQRGGLLHDIGKIGTPLAILDKRGKLTDDEMNTMRQHPRRGAEILAPVAAFQGVIPIVLHHHEWWDGSGYPDGISGEEIDLSARIFAVADVYDALASERPYRAAMPIEKVVEVITGLSGRQFDPTVVDVFLRVIDEETRIHGRPLHNGIPMPGEHPSESPAT